MNNKYYCPKCKCFELVLDESNLFSKQIIYVCKKCGYKQIDQPLLSNDKINTFPNPNKDFEDNNNLIDRIKNKRRTN